MALRIGLLDPVDKSTMIFPNVGKYSLNVLTDMTHITTYPGVATVLGLFEPEQEVTSNFRRVGKYLLIDMTQHHRRLEFSAV
jgi:selenocysteine lyase/cysteine desulfurase